jgi:hypothetical protein
MGDTKSWPPRSSRSKTTAITSAFALVDRRRNESLTGRARLRASPHEEPRSRDAIPHRFAGTDVAEPRGNQNRENPMRKIFAYSLLSAALAVGACKKSAEEKAEDRFEKAQENVKDQAEDINDEAKDIRDEQKDVRDEQKDVAKEQADLNKQQGEMNQAKQELSAAAADYKRVVNERLSAMDARINQLEARGDAKSRETAAKLRERRNELSVKMDHISDRADANWEQFKSDTDAKLNQLQKDIDEEF